jgi:hypothetical protein
VILSTRQRILVDKTVDKIVKDLNEGRNIKWLQDYKGAFVAEVMTRLFMDDLATYQQVLNAL